MNEWRWPIVTLVSVLASIAGCSHYAKLDQQVHLKAFDSGYNQIVLPGSTTSRWQKACE